MMINQTSLIGRNIYKMALARLTFWTMSPIRSLLTVSSFMPKNIMNRPIETEIEFSK
jgi:hypothetical protein